MLDAALQQRDNAEIGAPLPGFEIIPHRTVQAHVWALNSVFIYLTNQGSQALSLSRQAVDTMPETWLFARGNAMVYQGLSMFMEGSISKWSICSHRLTIACRIRARRTAPGCCFVSP